MRTVLITGASRGIGFETARVLAQKGYRVYGLVRPESDSSDLDELVGQSLSKLIGDVTDADSIEKAVQTILQEEGKIDVVINNACHLVFGTCETCTIEEQKMSMDVNYFGPIRVLQAVLPHMRRRRSGQVIQIGSVGGYEPFPQFETYVSTKFALEGLTESLASQLAPWNIHVSIVDPGNVKTEAPVRAPIGSRALHDTDAYQRYIMRSKQQRVDANEQALLPSDVVQVIEEILTSPRPHLRYPVGDFAKKRAEARFQDPSGDSYVAFKNELLASTYFFNVEE